MSKKWYLLDLPRLTNKLTVEQVKNATKIKGKPLDNFVRMESKHLEEVYEFI